ncbi:MAG: hypothetical protein EA426_20290 [Spirochaetaceae bacterium]|nr:MAG: hypothetical protein EA426_20290 [Spirochaetaceae bacterium]
MSRKVVTIAMALLVACAAFGQITVTLEDVDTAMIDPARVDLSDASILFHGPVEFYVTGIRYEGLTYTAVLEYDGGDTVRVRVPEYFYEGLPSSIDLSRVTAELIEDGILLNNVVIDNDRFSGILAPTAVATQLAVHSLWMDAAGVAPDAVVVDQLEREIAVLRNELSESERMVREKELEIARLAGRAVVHTEPTDAAWATANDRLTRERLSGFAAGTAASGSWTTTAAQTTQTDAAELYAKFVVPGSHGANETLVTLEARATGSGWRGYGVHFLASGSTRPWLYGYGRSYLVWVTRDPERYQTDATYVQLYRSSSDVDMVLVASKMVPESIGSNNRVQVHADRTTNELTVTMNGRHLFSFNDRGFLRSGTNVALRALGSITFTGLRVSE